MMMGAAGKYSADGEVDKSTLTHARDSGPSSGDSVIDIPAFLPAATSSTDFHQFVLDVRYVSSANHHPTATAGNDARTTKRGNRVHTDYAKARSVVVVVYGGLWCRILYLVVVTRLVVNFLALISFPMMTVTTSISLDLC